MKIAYENLQLTNAPFDAEISAAVEDVLKSGWYINGAAVTRFEKNFAAYIGAKHFVGVGNGLDALTLSLRAMDYPTGSDILTASNSYIATPLAIRAAGHNPVLVEPDIETYNIDPTRLASAMTPNTKAVMLTHLYGKAAHMAPIMAFAEAHGIDVFEDAAQAHGTKYKGQSAGTFGVTGSFSFYPTKNLGCFGDGGGISTNDDALAEKLRALRNYGSHQKYHNIYNGVNSRLDEVQAAILDVKLAHLNAISAHKRQLAEIYFDRLPDDLTVPQRHGDYHDVFHIFAVRTPERDALRAHLADHDIGTEVHYPIPPHRQKAMQGLFVGDFPIADELAETQISLPISYGTSQTDLHMVCDVINGYFGS
jgi:dTDP-4-amino-4,6-dideoxygalactose transaminase